jgi:hypothetical protein
MNTEFENADMERKVPLLSRLIFSTLEHSIPIRYMTHILAIGMKKPSPAFKRDSLSKFEVRLERIRPGIATVIMILEKVLDVFSSNQPFNVNTYPAEIMSTKVSTASTDLNTAIDSPPAALNA